VTSISSLPVQCICFQDGRTPFHAAAYNGHMDAMKFLLELGAKCDEKNNVSYASCIVCDLRGRRGVRV
jgi:ankyrin repeat protein